MAVAEPIACSAPVDSERFRKAMGCFATGIAVVTCRDEANGQIHGMTINSFTSISLTPPSILVSIKPGRMHRLISRENRFGVSILNHSQETYSTHFAGRPGDIIPDFLCRHEVPTLGDCLAWFECQVTSRIQVHDHTLFVANVVHCDSMSGVPLLFFSSRYTVPRKE